MLRMKAPDRRQYLLDVAAKLFARSGYHGATTAQLAEAAGVTEPVIYQHFSTKHDLFLATVETVLVQWLEKKRSEISRLDNAEQRLAALVALDPRESCHGHLLLQAVAQAETDQHVRELVQKHLHAIHRLVSRELESLLKVKGNDNNSSASDSAWLVIQQMVGQGVMSTLGLDAPSSMRPLIDILTSQNQGA